MIDGAILDSGKCLDNKAEALNSEHDRSLGTSESKEYESHLELSIFDPTRLVILLCCLRLSRVRWGNEPHLSPITIPH